MEINPHTKEAQFKNCAKRSASYGVGVKKPDIRYLKDVRKVAYDNDWFKKAPNQPVYYMHRAVKKRNGLQYDITVFPPLMFGKEFAKTKGHEHPDKYGEVYIVLRGEAIFLLQKRKGENIEDVYAAKAKKNDVIVIPPKYGHIAINAGKKQLKTANWTRITRKHDYSFFEKMRGACYYYILRPDSGQAGWIKNKKYKKVPKLRFEKPLKKLPKDLSFLKD